MTFLILGILGLISCVLLNLSFHYKTWRFAIIIPLLYLGYFGAVSQVPKFLGYAIPYEQSNIEEALVLYTTGPYLLVLVKGEEEPRLISFSQSEQNEERMKEINKRMKTEKVFLRKSKGHSSSTPGNGQFSDDGPDVINFSEQTIMIKE